MTQSSRRSSTLPFAISSALALSALGFAGSANAMTFHIHGNQIIATGSVSRTDPQVLSNLLERAAAQGLKIDTVVFRNSPGGAASGGVGMGEVIRARGLNTVLDGGCYSACADAFAAGVERTITRFGLPGASYASTALGIHGAASGGAPLPFPEQEIYLEYYRKMLGSTGWDIAGDRITQAHYGLQTQGGFLYYFDPELIEVATRFCPTGDTGQAGGCTDYRGVTMHSDTLATLGSYANANDVLRIDTKVDGDINPHLLVPGRYRSDQNNLREFDRIQPPDPLADAYGVVQIVKGGEWSLDTASAADFVVVDGGTLRLGANGAIRLMTEMGARNGGRIVLEQGAVRANTIIGNGGLLTGVGTLNATTTIAHGGTLRPESLVMSPYSLETLTAVGDAIFQNEPFRIGRGRLLNMRDGSHLAFDVDVKTDRAALTLERARYFTFDSRYGDLTLVANHNTAQLMVQPGAKLVLDVERGFFMGGHVTPLVAGRVDETALKLPEAPCSRGNWRARDFSGLDCVSLNAQSLQRQAPDLAFIDGRFSTVLRGADGEVFDLSGEDAVFKPRKNSLLSFNVHQTGEAISLEANRAFDDTSIFANAQSGNALGVALREASDKAASPLQPVLGALQFADRDVARAQAGALRGDGHASLRMADLALVDSFGGVVGQHVSSVRSRGEDGRGMAAMGAYASGAGTLAGNTGIQLNQLMMHFADPGTAGTAQTSEAGARFWARGFGQVGQLDAQGEVAKTGYNIGGVVLGVDTSLAQGKVVLGANLGFGAMTTRTRAQQFRGEVDALDIGGYLDADYGRGFVNAAVRYTDLDHDTTRSIVGIEGLEGAHEARYGNSALSARLEHGFTLRTAGGTVWQPLLPVIDYVRLDAVDFNENGVAALSGRHGDAESLRAGAGVQVWKNVQTGSGGVVTPHARVLWQKELGDRQVRYMTSFSVEPDLVFGTASQQTGDTALSWNLGVNSRATDRVSILLDYVGQRTDGGSRHGVMMGVGYRF